MKGKNFTVLVVLAMLALSLLSGCVIPADATPRGHEIDLLDTTWELIQLDGHDIAGGITIQFDGEKITLGPIGSTMMACLNMEHESAYLKALSESTGIRFEKEQLVLVDAVGIDRLVFVPMQHASLEGTSWALTGWNTGSAISSVVIDSEVTLEMNDGQVSGSAGCNHYFADYKVEDESLSFGTVGNTEMYCMDPEGVMEQEAGYLKALGQVNSFSVFGDILTMFDGKGTRLLTFVVAEKIR